MNNGSGDVTVQELASALIASFEGCRLVAYQDQGGVWTIGFGHTGTVDGAPVSAGMKITQAQADMLLATDQAKLYALVESRPVLESAALVSFGYNCGIGALQRVLEGQATIDQFNHIRGVVSEGLTRRRTLEELLIATSQKIQK